MISWPKPLPKRTGLLIVLMMSVFFALPPGVHLELCVGSDGHVDVAPDACRDQAAAGHHCPDTRLSGPDHHGDCLDIALACGLLGEVIPPARNGGLGQLLAETDSWPATPLLAALCSRHPESGLSRPLALLNRSALPPAHLAALRTVILLV
ncbi:MAG: hypothetical protein RI601_07330 [Desulfurivibrionaceae bacterium]|nr:hypothetical protein [Desulfurivibrionaceae bacterium]